MTAFGLYGACGLALFVLGLRALIAGRHLVRRLLGFNIAGSGAFLVLVSLASRGSPVDPVPQAMVLTGIVVAVASTALGIVLALRVRADTGAESLPDEGEQSDRKGRAGR